MPRSFAPSLSAYAPQAHDGRGGGRTRKPFSPTSEPDSPAMEKAPRVRTSDRYEPSALTAPEVPRRPLGRVEDGRGRCAPFPVPAHQIGRADFRHPAFRLASPHSFRWWPDVSVPKPHYPAFPVKIVIGKAAVAAPRHMVPPHKKVSNAFVDVVIDRPIRLQAGAIAEVSRPAAQKAVEPVPHIRPGSHIAGHQKIAYLVF